MRERHKNLNTQKKVDDQLKAAQQSAGQKNWQQTRQKTMAYLDGKVKRIILEIVKSRSIKKESIMVDPSLIECELISDAIDIRPSSSQPSSKKSRQPDTIDF